MAKQQFLKDNIKDAQSKIGFTFYFPNIYKENYYAVFSKTELSFIRL